MSVPTTISKQCMDLTQMLGVTCVPYLVEHQVDKVDTTSNPIHEWQVQAVIGPQSELFLRSLNSMDVANAELVLPVSDSHIAFAIPLMTDQSTRWFALGRFNSFDVELVRIAIRSATEAARRGFELSDQHQALVSLESELHRTSDERMWLRQLNSDRSKKHVRQNNSRQSIESLRALIQAESIALFVYSDVTDDGHGLQSIVTSKSPWQMPDVQQVLQRLGRPSCGDAIIVNDSNMKLQGGVLNECIIVPVGEVEAVGYLIAINRRRVGSLPNALSGAIPLTPANSLQTNRFEQRDAELMHELASILELDGQNNLLLKEGENLVLGTLRAMSKAIEARDPYTHGHSERVAQVGYEIATRLQLSEVACQEIYLAGILHDIGKIGIPDSVLLKPGKLTPEEYEIIKKHPEIGVRIIEDLGKLQFVLPGVLHHHERWDGSGYPYHLQRDRIPLMARILAVSDALDAITSTRVYRNAMLVEKAAMILKSGAGSQWDADAVDACIKYLDERGDQCQDLETTLNVARKPQDWRLVSRAISALQL